MAEEGHRCAVMVSLDGERLCGCMDTCWLGRRPRLHHVLMHVREEWHLLARCSLALAGKCSAPSGASKLRSSSFELLHRLVKDPGELPMEVHRALVLGWSGFDSTQSFSEAEMDTESSSSWAQKEMKSVMAWGGRKQSSAKRTRERGTVWGGVGLGCCVCVWGGGVWEGPTSDLQVAMGHLPCQATS